MSAPGKREFPLNFVPSLPEGESEPYDVRSSEEDDISTLIELYEQQRTKKLITRTRPESLWRFHVAEQDQGALGKAFYTILDASEAIVGYYGTWADYPFGRLIIRELNVKKGTSLNSILPTILRHISNFVEENSAHFGGFQPTSITFDLGYDETQPHDVFGILNSKLTPYHGWTWYMRVPNLARFIQHIAPALNQRLGASDIVPYDDDLKISFYNKGIHLSFERNQLVKTEIWNPSDIEEGYDAAFPDQIFLQLLFGYRSLKELRYAFPDCWTTHKSTLLLNTLFPKQTSWVIY